jgi:two-component system, chemotaxis family, chemotaxis protein CheY
MSSEFGSPGAPAAPLTILIVDDSPVMRSFIRRVVAMTGLEATIREASDGEGALEIVAAEPIDLVLSDINMPRMNGVELVRRLEAHESWKRIPVIVVSTDSSTVRVSDMLALGARGYVQKPFQPEALRAEIERVVG